MFEDIHNAIEVRRAISPTRQTNSDTAITSAIIDMSGYDSCEFLLALGTLTDTNATFAVTMAESAASNMSGSNTVAAADRIGSLPAPTFASDDAVAKFGYKGSKRYVQVTVTPSGNDAGNLDIAMLAVLGGAMKMPTP